MKRFIFKLVTLVEILALLGANSMATIVYASEQIADAKTSQENVSFSANINDTNDAKVEIGGSANLKLNVGVANTGYLKNIKITLDGNNYELENIADTSSTGDFAEISTNANTESSMDSNVSNMGVSGLKSVSSTTKVEASSEGNASSENKNVSSATNTLYTENTVKEDLSVVKNTIVENEVVSEKNSASQAVVTPKNNSTNSADSTAKEANSTSSSTSQATSNTNTIDMLNTSSTESDSETASTETQRDTANAEENKSSSISQIKSISGNVIELNEVNAGNSETIEIPITFKKVDMVSKEYYSKESTIKVEATYVNEKGKEKTIKKSINQKLEWVTNSEETVSQKLVRYLKFDKNTLVSFEINEGIKDNSIPITNKEINLVSEKINNQYPEKAIVTGKDISYSYENGNLTIKKEIKPDENGNYGFNSQDEYIVTYIYNTQENVNAIYAKAKANVTTIKGETISKETTENDFAISAEVGSIVDIEVSAPSEIEKGYLYTNLNREEKLKTAFNETYKINVGFAELVDKIDINENSYQLKKSSEETVDAKVKTSRITVDVKELVSVLGDNGTILVKDESGKEIGTLNKGLSELVIDADKLSFEFSKPQTEGNIAINLEKYIDGNNDYTRDDIKSFETFTSEVELTSIKSETKILDKKVENEAKLNEPTSKATLYVSTDTLSTVVENRNVIFNVVLDTNDISDALYKDPTIKITLPDEVQKIDITDAQVFYDDEITAGNFNVKDNQLIVSLTGLETQYSSSAASNGTLIRIVANISLDNLATSNVSSITLEYSNALTGENNIVEGNMNVVAPSGFVTTNTISIDGKSETALEEDAKNIEIDRDSTSRKATISGKIVNNVGQEADGVIIIGRIPFEGNKTEMGEDLQTTVTAILTSPVSTDMKNATIYYSENGDEQVDSTTWTTEFMANAKSFKIVANSSLANKTISNFSYHIEFPSDLGYEKVAKESYGVYYKNGSTVGNEYNLIQSKIVSISTGKKPDVTMSISAEDINEGYAIDENGKVTQGETIKYKVKITNDGSKKAQNVKLNVSLPVDSQGNANEVFLDYDDEENKYVEKSEKDTTIDVGEINPGETKVSVIPVKVNGSLKDVSPKEFGIEDKESLSDEEYAKAIESGKLVTTKFELNVPGIANIKREYTVKETEGGVTLQLSSYPSDVIEKDERINFKIDVINTNDAAKENVKVSLILPKGMVYDGNYGEFDYDEKTNVVSKTITLKENKKSRKLIVTAKVTGDISKSLDVVATANCNNKDVKSNTVSLINKATSVAITAKQTTNISSGKIDDTDSIEYYIQLESKSKVDTNVMISDDIPKEFSVRSVKVKVGDDEEDLQATNYIRDSITIPANSTARITIKADTYPQTYGTSVKTENIPQIYTLSGIKIDVNSATIEINGSNTEKREVPQSVTNQEQTRKINGTVWLDENNNGIMEETEKKISGVEVKLYDSATKTVAKDVNGNELVTSTDENGQYTFSNVKLGNYTAIANYDNKQYTVGIYDAEGSTSAEKSTFIQTKLNNTDVASSDIIKVERTNVYNNNLALATKDTFDLNLEQTISKVVVVNSQDKKQNTSYDFNKNIAKVELRQKNVDKTTVLVEYKIKITNIGNVPGYAKKIVDYIPQGLTFNSDINPDWYIQADGYLYNSKTANMLINPGETKEIALTLTKKMTGENVGNIRNTAEIAQTYNEYGIKDENSQELNKKDGENDMSSADIIILMSAGRERVAVFGIALGIFAIIAYVVFYVKKNFIDKMYNNYYTEE